LVADAEFADSLGQFYCTPCGRHFIDATTRDVHMKTKVHKRRCVLRPFVRGR
jgi:hypothetical protein